MWWRADEAGDLASVLAQSFRAARKRFPMHDFEVDLIKEHMWRTRMHGLTTCDDIWINVKE